MPEPLRIYVVMDLDDPLPLRAFTNPEAAERFADDQRGFCHVVSVPLDALEAEDGS